MPNTRIGGPLNIARSDRFPARDDVPSARVRLALEVSRFGTVSVRFQLLNRRS